MWHMCCVTWNAHACTLFDAIQDFLSPFLSSSVAFICLRRQFKQHSSFVWDLLQPTAFVPVLFSRTQSEFLLECNVRDICDAARFYSGPLRGHPLPEGGVIRTALVVPCRLMSKLAALRPLISQRPAYSPWPGLAWLVFSVCLSCALDDISIRRLQADQRCDVRTGRKKTQRGDANCRLLLLASSDLSGAIEQGN